ncbi:MAG TPA: ATP-binding protein [Ramlibacter sp.]|nr:ATP-binding protein [Ramlibacter sp.]
MAGPASIAPWTDAAGEDSAFVRLWRGFATARVAIAVVLLALLLAMMTLATAPVISRWLIGLCSTYLAATLAVRVFTRPLMPGQAFDPQWVSTVGVDLLAFAALQFLQAGGINYSPLFAVPVLMASVLGSALLAFGTAAAVALLLLAEAWVLGLQASSESAPRLLQAGLTGTGYFALAFLANQLAVRLAREEAAARRSRKAAYIQTQVNELVIETLADGVLVVDRLGEVHAANPAARALLGATAVQARRLLLSAEPAWHPLVEMARRTFDGGGVQVGEVSIEEAGSPPRRVMARTRLTPETDPAAEGLCVLFLQDLREMEARLRTEKLAAMGRMSAAVAHEIRNPLAAISQANELLEEELSEPSHRQLSSLVRQNAQRLAQIVEEILNISRVQRQGPAAPGATLELDPAVAAACQDWGAQNRSAGRLHVALRAPGARVAFDADHLRRVLVNLLDNALRYAGDAAGSIQVATVGAPACRLVVWSDGPALESAVERHLFEPFFSSESRSSGLGLYICRELCERHGARIAYARQGAPGDAQRQGNAFMVAFRTGPGPFAGAPAFDTMAA